ncbi:Conserved_hypothetical protein [Hexamita inflata]|uniref:Uncharacterized protein n=1 Tax=Hexamita inflata TaxID=28002 RepID=A0ABP1HC66_9EUKA
MKLTPAAKSTPHPNNLAYSNFNAEVQQAYPAYKNTPLYPQGLQDPYQYNPQSQYASQPQYPARQDPVSQQIQYQAQQYPVQQGYQQPMAYQQPVQQQMYAQPQQQQYPPAQYQQPQVTFSQQPNGFQMNHASVYNTFQAHTTQMPLLSEPTKPQYIQPQYNIQQQTQQLLAQADLQVEAKVTYVVKLFGYPADMSLDKVIEVYRQRCDLRGDIQINSFDGLISISDSNDVENIINNTPFWVDNTTDISMWGACKPELIQEKLIVEPKTEKTFEIGFFGIIKYLVLAAIICAWFGQFREQLGIVLMMFLVFAVLTAVWGAWVFVGHR